MDMCYEGLSLTNTDETIIQIQHEKMLISSCNISDLFLIWSYMFYLLPCLLLRGEGPLGYSALISEIDLGDVSKWWHIIVIYHIIMVAMVATQSLWLAKYLKKIITQSRNGL